MQHQILYVFFSSCCSKKVLYVFFELLFCSGKKKKTEENMAPAGLGSAAVRSDGAFRSHLMGRLAASLLQLPARNNKEGAPNSQKLSIFVAQINQIVDIRAMTWLIKMQTNRRKGLWRTPHGCTRDALGLRRQDIAREETIAIFVAQMNKLTGQSN